MRASGRLGRKSRVGVIVWGEVRICDPYALLLKASLVSVTARSGSRPVVHDENHMGRPALGTRVIDIRDLAVVEVVAEPEFGGVFELVRRFGRPATAAELESASGLARTRVMECVDALVSAGLVRPIRPRAPRKVFAYEATCSRIVVAYDGRDSGDSEAVLRLQARATRDAEEALRARPAGPIDGVKGKAWHQTRIKCRLRPEHLKGLGQRLHAVGEYLMQVASEATLGEPGASPLCNFVVGINLVPLDVPLLPSAPIVAVPHTAVGASIASDASTGFAGLTVRERQVAVALRDGRTRNQIARELGISPNTVGTVTRKLYAKLGVHRRAELVTRLAGLAAG